MIINYRALEGKHNFLAAQTPKARNIHHWIGYETYACMHTYTVNNLPPARVALTRGGHDGGTEHRSTTGKRIRDEVER